MRDDLVVPGEGEENYVLARDARVVTVPFSPLEERMQKEKPEMVWESFYRFLINFLRKP